MNEKEQLKYNDIFIANYRAILRYFYFRVGDGEDARELTQDVFLALLEKWDSLGRRETNYRAWLYAVARNTLTNYMRRKKRLVTVSSDSDPAAAKKLITEFEYELEHEPLCEQELLERILPKLSDDDRKLLELLYGKKADYEAIETALGVTNITARSRVCRLKAKIKRLLEEK